MNKKELKWKKDTKLIEVFFKHIKKTRTETDKILLKFQEWSDFNKIPQKDLASAEDESWEMLSKIVKMIKKFNKKY